MEDAGQGQLVKAGLLLAAGVAFGVWQWRDLARARRQLEAERARQRADEGQVNSPPPKPGTGQEPP